jgi:hypothetical protein
VQEHKRLAGRREKREGASSRTEEEKEMEMKREEEAVHAQI